MWNLLKYLDGGEDLSFESAHRQHLSPVPQRPWFTAPVSVSAIMVVSFTGVGVSVTAVHRHTHRQPDWFSSLDLCGISHSGGLAGTAGSLRHCWERESLEWVGFFFFLLLRPLRFPPVLTWLRLYNSPERVTSSRVEIPGFFFSLSLYPFSFFLFYWKGGVGAAVIVEHLSGSQLQRQGQPVIYGNICKMQSPCICF